MFKIFTFKFGETDGADKGRWVEGSVRPQEGGKTYRLMADLYFKPWWFEKVMICNRVTLTVRRPFEGTDFWAHLTPMTTRSFAVTGNRRQFECDSDAQQSLQLELNRSAFWCGVGEVSLSSDLEAEIGEIESQLVAVRKREFLQMAHLSRSSLARANREGP